MSGPEMIDLSSVEPRMTDGEADLETLEDMLRNFRQFDDNIKPLEALITELEGGDSCEV